MPLTEQGIEKFRQAQARAEADVAAVTDNVAALVYQGWLVDARQSTAIGTIEDRLVATLPAGHLDTVDAELAFYDLVRELEEHAFIVGFEAARRILTGGGK